MEASKENLRFYVYTRWLLNVATPDIHQELRNSWGDVTPTLRTLQLWTKSFANGAKTSLLDAPRSGRPRTSLTNEKMQALKEALDTDPFLSVRQLSDAIDEGKSSVHRLLTEMNYRNISCMWVPHELSTENMKARKQCAEALVTFLTATANLKDVYAVQDETWVYFDYWSQAKKKAWVAPGGDRPQMAKFSPMTKRKTSIKMRYLNILYPE